ncbi:hypothetical protein C8R44DRAFT_788906, partial [Mycena epipterygia]
MLGDSTHPSSTSVDSTTALASSYRPPQKDYAAAFGALQVAYGAPGSGYGPSTGSTVKNPAAAPERAIPSPKSPTAVSYPTNDPPAPPGVTSTPKNASESSGDGPAKETGKRIIQAVGSMLKKIFRWTGGHIPASFAV